jgi:membrane protease YdiL (CAAX protease family)
MHGLKRFVQARPAACYFALTFAISWGGLVAVFSRAGIVAPAEDFVRLLPLAVAFIVLGPSVSGIACTALEGGRPALRDYRRRLLAWRVRPRWYAAALLTAPLYFLLVSAVLSQASPDFRPALLVADDRSALLARGIAIALAAGIVEELGWTGFAVPVVRRRHGGSTTGLVVGVFWGIWHVLPKLTGADAHGLLPYLAADLLAAIVGLTGYRILMVWLYEETESLFLGILMHFGLTASTLLLTPAVTGAKLMTHSYLITLAPWLIVAGVAVLRRGHPRHSQQSHVGRPASSSR